MLPIPELGGFFHSGWVGRRPVVNSHEVGGGNVFADLGLPNSEQELGKAKLTVQIEANRLLGTTRVLADRLSTV